MPISELHAHVLAVRFQHWDRNHNGYLELSDMEETARRLGAVFGRAADSPQQLALLNSFRQHWQALARHADVDHDGRISLDEYVAAFSDEVLTGPGIFEPAYRTLLENVIDVADTNGDGKLDEAEFVRLMGNFYNSEESVATEMFSRQDQDGDGLLTVDEMIQHSAKFFLTDDPSLTPPPSR